MGLFDKLANGAVPFSISISINLVLFVVRHVTLINVFLVCGKLDTGLNLNEIPVAAL